MKILGHPWHAGHNYELLKLPYDWHYLPGDWHTRRRPFPNNVTWVDWGFDPSDYDLILTHFSHEACGYLQRLIEYRDRIPMIAIMHGVPRDEAQARYLRELVGDMLIVCNSWQQEREWTFERSKTIIHGFDEKEWPQTDYSKNEIVTTLPGIKASHPLFGENYGIEMLEEVRKHVPITWIGRDIRFENWQQYKKYLRHCSIYFNPTLRSPMPRARGEAMMMGLATVTTPHYFDDYRYWSNPARIVLNAEDSIEALHWLLQKRNLQSLNGATCRAFAVRNFSWDRWSKEWQETINEEIDSFGSRRAGLGDRQHHPEHDQASTTVRMDENLLDRDEPRADARVGAVS